MLKRFIAGWLVAMTGLLAAPIAWAEDLALIVTNEFYDNYPTVQGAGAIGNLERDFRNAGFEVVLIRNLAKALTARDSGTLLGRLNRADRLVAVFSGHFARTGDTDWLLNTTANNPNGFTIGASALPITGVMDIASRKQGDAVIAIATDGTEIPLGFGTMRLRVPDIPQGVTYIRGTPRQVAGFIANAVLRPGQVLAEAAEAAPNGLIVRGFLPPRQAFLPVGALQDFGEAAERAFWQQALQLDTEAAYRDYLNRYPNGLFRNEAAQREADLRITPLQRAEAAENSLNLSRDQRQTIQRNLNLLGIETGGIDGIFGRRSRNGIAEWQRRIGVPDTGYLNANQITRIANSAAIRAAELRAEAERRRAETERSDRAYWAETGAGGSEGGLQQYLQRYSDGIFADEARARLQEIERQQRRLARREEREYWDRTVMQGTLDAYQQYLDAYPNGRFTEEARARVVSLSRPETAPELVEAARREEEALSLNRLTRQLIEVQLNKLNLEPGNVDGVFDRNTRRALRRYERDNGLPVTSFVTRAVIIRLLASATNQ